MKLHKKTSNIKRMFRSKVVLIILFLVMLIISGCTRTSNVVNSTDKKSTVSLKVGDYIQLAHYDGQPILWKVINIDDKGIMVLSDKILCLKAFDARGDLADGRGDTGDVLNDYRILRGSNYWEKSNIREWLNSDAKVVKYSHQPPDEDHVKKNPYNAEPGFLYNFTSEERNLIQEADVKTVVSKYDMQVKNGGDKSAYKDLELNEDFSSYDKMPYKITREKVFLLSVKEVKEYLYDKGIEYKAKPTVQCANKEQDLGLDPTEYNRYILRNPSYTEAYWISSIETKGGVYYNIPAYNGERGIRPALYLNKSTKLKSGSGTQEDPYIFSNNVGNTNSTKDTDNKQVTNKENKNNNRVSDSGNPADGVLNLTDEERAHLYDTNGPHAEFIAKQARQLVLNEDSQYISKITNKSTKLSNDYKEYSAENMPTKNNWNIPAEPCYVFYIDNYSDDGKVTDTSKEYLVGKNSKNVYIIPNQGGQSAYQIKNNQKVKTFKYAGQDGSQEWR